MTARKTRKTTEERRAQTAALRERLEQYAEGLDEEQIALITSLHDGYSERNAMLIAMQMPEATDVSGFKAWLDRGRVVRKGEHGIQILAPAGHRDAVEATEDTEAQSARQFFRLVPVFDVSQTDELPAKAAA
jgi:antirestriction protein ArdC